MPNHFTTIGLCGRDYSNDKHELINEGKLPDVNEIEGRNLCVDIMPLPDELRGIVASYPPCRYRNKQTGEFSKDDNTPTGTDLYERIDLTDAEIAKLTDRHGWATWYDWATNTYGTKWGTYEVSVHQLGGDGRPVLIEFQSAWGPPNAATMRKITDYLEEKYALKNIRWIGHNPYDNSTVDIEIDPPVSARC